MKRVAGKGGRGRRRRDWRRYPITSAMVRSSMLGVYIRMAQLKGRVGSRDPVLKEAVVTQAVTSLEQFLRLVLEERLDAGRGAAHRVVDVKDMAERVRVSVSRIDASMRGFQNVKAIRRLARECGLSALLECLDGADGALAGALDLRHDVVHALGRVRVNDAEAFFTIESIMVHVQADRPRHRATALLVEAAVMDADGRAGAARKAALEALRVCNDHEGWADDEDGGLRRAVCRAHALARLRRTAEAEAAYREAAEADPRSVLPLFGMGNLLVQAGRHEEAAGWYERAVAVDPGHAAVRISMGHALAVSRGPDGQAAVQCYQDAMEIDSEDVSLRAGYGTALAMGGNHVGAAEQYRLAIKLDPHDAAAHVGLGNALLALGRHGEAVKAYRVGVEKSVVAVFVPPEPDGTKWSGSSLFAHELGGAAAHRGMGNALLELGRPDEAAGTLREAVALDADSLGAQLGLGRSLYKCGRHEEAVPAYRAAAGIESNSFDAQLGLGRSLYKCGRHEEAVPAYRAAAGIESNSFDAQLGLGRALYACGRHEEAVPAYRAAAGLGPNSLDAQLGLGRALYACGRYKEAGPPTGPRRAGIPTALMRVGDQGFARRCRKACNAMGLTAKRIGARLAARQRRTACGNARATGLRISDTGRTSR